MKKQELRNLTQGMVRCTLGIYAGVMLLSALYPHQNMMKTKPVAIGSQMLIWQHQKMKLGESLKPEKSNLFTLKNYINL